MLTGEKLKMIIDTAIQLGHGYLAVYWQQPGGGLLPVVAEIRKPEDPRDQAKLVFKFDEPE